jgi:hypothetical protein
MRPPCVDDIVRLTRDIPELSLHRGDLGVVRSTWFAPATAYEVEFHLKGHDMPPRALLLPEHITVQDGVLMIDLEAEAGELARSGGGAG